MAYVANVVHERTGKLSTREAPSAENGAQQLVMLMGMSGWTEDAVTTAARLVAGEEISFKGFTYSVREEGAA